MGDPIRIQTTATAYVQAARERARLSGGPVRLNEAESNDLVTLTGKRVDPGEARALTRAGVTADMIATDGNVDMLSMTDTRATQLLRGRQSMQAQIARGGVGFWSHVDQVGGAVAPARMRDGMMVGSVFFFAGPEAGVPAVLLGAGFGWLQAGAEGVWSAFDD